MTEPQTRLLAFPTGAATASPFAAALRSLSDVQGDEGLVEEFMQCVENTIRVTLQRDRLEQSLGRHGDPFEPIVLELDPLDTTAIDILGGFADVPDISDTITFSDWWDD